MKRPTKKAASPVNRLLLATILLLAFAGTIGLATVWLRHQISDVAQANKRMQQRIVEVQRCTAQTNAEIAAALNPEVLLSQNHVLRLGLEMPRDYQIVSVAEPVEVRLASKQNAERFTTTLVSTALPLTTTR
ncbi:MAG TPA: hypothetical protein VK178_09695 [Opitutaceae bacterium]|nr:hypothetical protein [Opitutaceae bacterium]